MVGKPSASLSYQPPQDSGMPYWPRVQVADKLVMLQNKARLKRTAGGCWDLEPPNLGNDENVVWYTMV